MPGQGVDRLRGPILAGDARLLEEADALLDAVGHGPPAEDRPGLWLGVQVQPEGALERQHLVEHVVEAAVAVQHSRPLCQVDDDVDVAPGAEHRRDGGQAHGEGLGVHGAHVQGPVVLLNGGRGKDHVRVVVGRLVQPRVDDRDELELGVRVHHVLLAGRVQDIVGTPDDQLLGGVVHLKLARGLDDLGYHAGIDRVQGEELAILQRDVVGGRIDPDVVVLGKIVGDAHQEGLFDLDHGPRRLV